MIEEASRRPAGWGSPLAPSPSPRGGEPSRLLSAFAGAHVAALRSAAAGRRPPRGTPQTEATPQEAPPPGRLEIAPPWPVRTWPGRLWRERLRGAGTPDETSSAPPQRTRHPQPPPPSVDTPLDDGSHDGLTVPPTTHLLRRGTLCKDEQGGRPSIQFIMTVNTRLPVATFALFSAPRVPLSCDLVLNCRIRNKVRRGCAAPAHSGPRASGGATAGRALGRVSLTIPGFLLPVVTRCYRNRHAPLLVQCGITHNNHYVYN